MRYILYWIGHGTFSRGSDLLDAYKHAEYFEAVCPNGLGGKIKDRFLLKHIVRILSTVSFVNSTQVVTRRLLNP